MGDAEGCAAVGVFLICTILLNFTIKQNKCFESFVPPPVSKKLSR